MASPVPAIEKDLSIAGMYIQTRQDLRARTSAENLRHLTVYIVSNSFTRAWLQVNTVIAQPAHCVQLQQNQSKISRTLIKIRTMPDLPPGACPDIERVCHEITLVRPLTRVLVVPCEPSTAFLLRADLLAGRGVIRQSNQKEIGRS